MLERAHIKQQAKIRFQSQYGISLGTFILYYLIGGAATGATWGLGSFFLVPPLMVGYSLFCVKIYRGETGAVEVLFGGFKNYWRNVGGILWMELFTFLWTLLFIIPGIIKMFAYFMTPYILADCPNVKATDALKLSMRMTKGYKGKIFVMCLSFIGWLLLSALTCGILNLLYVGPYMQTSFAGMYDELKKNALANGVVTAEELA